MGAKFMVELFDKVARGKAIYRLILTPLAPIVFFGFIATLFYGARRIDVGMGWTGIFPAPWHVWLSRPLLLGGLAMMVWAAAHFFRAGGTPVPFNPPPRLVVSGPYASSRNPMMLGLFSVLLGLGVRFQSPVWLGVFLPLLIALIRLQLCEVEEPGLERRFGEAYRAYQNRTPRFFPRPKGKRRNIELA